MNGGWHSFATLPPPDPSVVRRALKRGSWTTHEERNLLRMRSEGKTETEIATHLFRSVSSVRGHVYRMKNPALSSFGARAWDPAEEEEFSALIGQMPMRLIAVRLNRSLESVKSKKLKMILRRIAGNRRKGSRVYCRWTDQEKAKLVYLWPVLSTTKIARRLNRTYRCIYAKAREIGLPGRHKL